MERQLLLKYRYRTLRNPDPGKTGGCDLIRIHNAVLTDITELLIDVEEGLLRGLGALGQAVHLILEAFQQRRHRQPISARLFSHVTGLRPITKGKREFF